MAADFDKMVKDSGLDPREFVAALACMAAHAYDEDEETEVRRMIGLE